ncbi:helix-turn-helix domain-containing protein [Deinococcus sp. UYEF24]
MKYANLPGPPSPASMEIQRAMQTQQVTLADLASKMGVRPSLLAHWLDPDNHNLKMTTVQWIADALDCELITRFRLDPE